MDDSNRGAHSALTVRCRRCDGRIELAEVAPEVKCPFCGTAQAIDPALIDRLRRYQADVRSKYDQIRAEEKQVAAWDRWYGKAKPGSSRIVLLTIALFMGLPLVIMGLFQLLLSLKIIGPRSGALITYVILGAEAVVLIAFYWRMYSGKGGRRGSAAVAEAHVACPACGADNSFRAGQVLERCRFCGSSLLPSKTVMHESLEKAQQAVRAVQMERFRKEREGMVKVMSYSMGGAMHYFILGPFILMTGAGAIGFTFEMARGTEKYNPAIFIMWLFFFGCIGTLIGITWWKREVKRRWGEALAALTGQLGGQVCTGMGDVVGWLNTFWAGPYNIVNIITGDYASGARLDLQGYPALFFADPVAAGDKNPAKVHLFLAAWIPGVSDGSDPQAGLDLTGRAAAGWPHGGSFAVEVQQGGLLATADRRTVKCLRREPERTAATVVPVLHSMAALARSMQARPVEPIRF